MMKASHRCIIACVSISASGGKIFRCHAPFEQSGGASVGLGEAYAVVPRSKLMMSL